MREAKTVLHNTYGDIASHITYLLLIPIPTVTRGTNILCPSKFYLVSYKKKHVLDSNSIELCHLYAFTFIFPVPKND